MEKIKKIINNTLFLSALSGVVGFLLMIQGNVMYAGLAFGVSICKFIDAFKED
jgi:hypothetical protein